MDGIVESNVRLNVPAFCSPSPETFTVGPLFLSARSGVLVAAAERQEVVHIRVE